jgi:hypothetical protein
MLVARTHPLLSYNYSLAPSGAGVGGSVKVPRAQWAGGGRKCCSAIRPP